MAGNSYHDRLQEDAPYLTSNGKLSERAVDKIILQLNRVYPQIIYNKDAEKFRNPKTPLRKRLSDLLTYLQNKGDLACQEFYRALRNNAESVYATLPSRNNLSNPSSPVEIIRSQEKIILNDRGPVFFLACFSVAAGLAFLMYCNTSELKPTSASKKVFGFSALGFGRHIKNILISYLEEVSVDN
uniref:Caspase recruitment domain-containing protein 19 n=1 Tax=Leptobrachium leishanense TaxID=445787 RepID=A0A8C5R1B0_9ANUR